MYCNRGSPYPRPRPRPPVASFKSRARCLQTAAPHRTLNFNLKNVRPETSKGRPNEPHLRDFIYASSGRHIPFPSSLTLFSRFSNTPEHTPTLSPGFVTRHPLLPPVRGLYGRLRITSTGALLHHRRSSNSIKLPTRPLHRPNTCKHQAAIKTTRRNQRQLLSSFCSKKNKKIKL